MRFSDELKQGVAPLWERMVTHDFVMELGEGTLPWDTFQRYFRQDYVFLRGWLLILALGIGKSQDFKKARVLTDFLQMVLNAEDELFQTAFREMGMSQEEVDGLEPLPTCYAFQSYLTNLAFTGDFEEIVTAFLCVEWTYLDWAQRLDRAGKRPENPHYQAWIDIHASQQLADLVSWMRGVVDSSPMQGRDKKRAIFHQCLRYEYMFWEMAYHGQEWPG